MKKIVCLCVILLCSASFVFAQKNKRKTIANKKAAVSSVAEAEKAWKEFFPKFKEAVKNKDRAFIKGVMYKEFRCWGWNTCGGEDAVKPTDSLFRDWDDNEESGWKDLLITLSDKKFDVAEKDYWGIYTKGMRTEWGRRISFEFHSGRWRFAGFKFAEGA